MADKLELLKKNLIAILDSNKDQDVGTIAGYVVGELIGDYNDQYEGLDRQYDDVDTISTIASSLEANMYLEKDRRAYFNRMVYLIRNLPPVNNHKDSQRK